MFKKIILLSFLFFSLHQAIVSEDIESEHIMVEERFLGTVYKYENEFIKLKDVENYLVVDPEALALFNKGKVPYYTGIGFSSAGGALIGYQIGSALSGGGDVNWSMIGIGAGAFVISLILSKKGDTRFRNGVVLYNTNLK